LGRKIAAAIAFGLLMLALVGVMSYRSIHEFIQSAGGVTRGQRAMVLIEATLGDVASAESEARGFILTGEENFRTVYEKSAAEVADDLNQLHGLISDASALKLLEEMDGLIQQRLVRLGKAVGFRQRPGFDITKVNPSVGKKMMDDLRRLTDALETVENNLLREHDERAQRLAGQTKLVIVLGSLLALLIAGFSMVIIIIDLGHRERLEREVLEISEREQRRIGQDLHDGVCQHLTGVSLLCRSLQQKLAKGAAVDPAEAERITRLVNEGIEQTRLVTHGLYPVANEPSGLMLALQALSANLHDTDHLVCQFECPVPVPIGAQMVATHLYRIAQEAAQNALRHAHPTSIIFRLESDADCVSLTVTDDGCGLPDNCSSKGLGLELMHYRARTLGADLEVRRGAECGTVVRCVLPISAIA